jgi:hypothetical protein
MKLGPLERHISVRRVLWLVLTLLTVGGCSDPVGRVPVSGKITYGGGTWPTDGVIYFKPLAPAPGFPQLTGIAYFGPHGSFDVQSTGSDRGLVPGRYAVQVECWETPPNMEGKPVKSFLPADYRGSELTIELGAKSKRLTLDVPKRQAP